mmetsp:Transcript_8381/g.23815  ORF Transcript_8381/g.23815 Transcript_8381/m.23815 type:complete len:94 (+) Transcript_8381:348-629(+)
MRAEAILGVVAPDGLVPEQACSPKAPALARGGVAREQTGVVEPLGLALGNQAPAEGGAAERPPASRDQGVVVVPARGARMEEPGAGPLGSLPG